MNKISYALGLGIAHQLKSMGIEDFSVEDFSQSVSDVLADKTPAMTNREAQELLNDYFQKKQKEEAEKAIAEGKVFLEANGKREGVTTTKSGLQYEVLTPGKGERSPKATDITNIQNEEDCYSGRSWYRCSHGFLRQRYAQGQPEDRHRHTELHRRYGPEPWTQGVSADAHER